MKWNRDFRWTMAIIGLLSVVVVVLFLVFDRKDANDTYIPAEVPMTAEIRELQEFVRIETTSGKELDGARYLQELLKRYGVESELIVSGPGRGNVYARIRGKRPDEGLMLLQHIDVVPANAADWKNHPFKAEIVLHWMIGRGTLDMKSVGMTHLYAFVDLAKSGKVPERDVVFLATSDEETGGTLGIAWLLQHRPEVFEGIRYAISEGGITETTAEKINYFGVEVGTKSFTTVWVSAADSATIDRVATLIAPFESPMEPLRLLPEVREFFREVAPYRIEPKPLLMDIDKTIRDGKFGKLHPTYRTLTQNTAYARMRRQTGDRWELLIVLANLPDEEPEPRIAWLRGLLAGEKIRYDSIAAMPRLGLSSTGTPFFALIEREVRKQYGEEVHAGPLVLSGVSTDCRYLRARGVSCYGMWPFPVEFAQTGGIHGVNERLRLDWYLQGVTFTKSLVRSYALGQ